MDVSSGHPILHLPRESARIEMPYSNRRGKSTQSADDIEFPLVVPSKSVSVSTRHNKES